MKHRLTSSILIGTGIVLVTAGLVVMLGIAPRYRTMQDAMTLTQRYEGTLRTSIDVTTLESLRSPRLNVQRSVSVADTHGSTALVRDERVVRIPQGRLRRTVVHYALDRTTMLCTDSYPESWSRSSGFWPRLGLMALWPYDVARRDYELWVDAYRRAVPLRFAGEVEHARSARTAYRFTASGDQQPMSPDEVEFLKLPETIDTERLQTLQENPDVNPVLRRLLPDVLAAWTEETVPVAYSWEFHTTYWVEPRTGILLDMRTRNTLRVGVAEEVVTRTALATLPAAQRATLEVIVEDASYVSTEATVAAAVKQVDQSVAALELHATILPIVLVVTGLVVGTAGSLLVIRRRRASE